MLGSYMKRGQQARKVGQATKVRICTYPLLYCQGGAVVGYALDGYVAGQKQTFYFDANWQPLTTAPAGAQPCCERTSASRGA